jgi:hypothetical protein
MSYIYLGRLGDNRLVARPARPASRTDLKSLVFSLFLQLLSACAGVARG